MKRSLPTDPPHLKAAFADLGLSEIPGPKHSARVLELFKLAGHPEVKNDETAWCAAAVGGWLAESGYKPSGSLMARSYVKYGVACDLSKRVPRGAIMVWPRGAPPSGHVNICLDDDGTFLTCIGGNQGNGNGGGVTISRERKANAIAARLPPGARPGPRARPVDVEPSPPDDPGHAQDEAPPKRKKTWITETGTAAGAGGAIETIRTANEVATQVREAKENASELASPDLLSALFTNVKFLVLVAIMIVIVGGVVWWQFKKWSRK